MFGRTLLRAPNSRPNGRMMGREAGRGNPFPAWKSTTHSATAEKEARIQGERVGGEATGFGHLGIGRTASCGGGKDCVATLHVVASGHLARSGSLASQAGGAGIRGVLARRAASDGEITKKVNDDGGGRCIAVWRSRSGVQRAHLCPLAKQWMTTSAPPHPHPRPRLLLPATARNIRWRGGQEFLSYFFHLLQRRSLRALPSLPRSAARGR